MLLRRKRGLQMLANTRSRQHSMTRARKELTDLDQKTLDDEENIPGRGQIVFFPSVRKDEASDLFEWERERTLLFSARLLLIITSLI
jgi:hypothetical protein